MPRKIFITINLLLSIFVVFFLTYALTLKHHTLYDDGNWISKKATIYKSLVGSRIAMVTGTLVAEDALHLTDWHGYQQFTCKHAYPFAQAGFIFTPRDYFAFIVNDADTQQCGYLFNRDRCAEVDTCTGAFFIQNKEGKFGTLDTFKLHYKHGDALWNRVTVNRKGDTLQMELNGVVQHTIVTRLPQLVKMGLKGSHHNVLVDDFYIKKANGEVVFSDNFSTKIRVTPILIWPLIVCLLTFFSYKTQFQKWAPAVTFIHFVSLLLIMMFAFNQWQKASTHPDNENDVDWRGEVVFHIESDKEVMARAAIEHPIANQNKNILVLGSSQIWGMGASAENFTMPAVLQAKLRSNLKDTLIHVINAGVCGRKSFDLYKMYTEYWQLYKPVLVIINLSGNDNDTVVFKHELEKFVDFNNKAGCKTLFIAEANDLPDDYLRSKHRVMQHVAEKRHVAFINMQPYADSMEQTGFMWWDIIHMTDYGYRLFAEHITPDVERLLTEPADNNP